MRQRPDSWGRRMTGWLASAERLVPFAASRLFRKYA